MDWCVFGMAYGWLIIGKVNCSLFKGRLKMKELFGLTSAFRMFSILPCWGENSTKYGRVLVWSPLVGFIISLLCTVPCAFIMWTVCGGHPSTFIEPHTDPNPRWAILYPLAAVLGAILYVGLEAFLTRAFHLDGLADTFDGWGGGWNKEDTLKIMRDHNIGTFGTVALIITLLVKVASVAILLLCFGLRELVLIPVLARFFMVAQAAFNKYAREGEESLAGSVVKDVKWLHVALAAITVMYIFDGSNLIGNSWLKLQFYWYPIVGHLDNSYLCLALGVILTWLIALISRRRLEGITGDILGATVELNEALMLWGAALATLIFWT